MTQPLKSRQLLGYGCADAGQALVGTLIGFYQLYFFTDIMRLPLTRVAGLFLLTKVLDSVCYPLFGMVVDRLAGRVGHRRWLGWLILPIFISSALLFSFNRNWDTATRIGYAYCVVSLFVIVSALSSVVYAGLVSSIANLASERARLSTTRFICAFGAGTVGSFSIKYIVDYFGGKDSGGFFYVALLFSFASALMLYVTYASTTECVTVPKVSSSVNLLAGIRVLLRSNIFLAPLFATVFSGIFVAIKSQTTLYFITHVMRRPDIANFMLAAGTVSCAAGVALVGLFINRIDRQKLYIGLMTGNALFIAAIYIINENNISLIIVSHCLNAMLGGACAPIMFSIYSDVVDYFDQTSGHRAPALINSLAMLGGRLGGSLGMVLTPLGLAYFHYQPDVAQSSASQHGIALMFALVPAGFALLSAVAMVSYNITNQQAEATSRRLFKAMESA